MERLIVQAYDANYLRNTMLKHEEIFRQQVSELHHLYRVQKELMTELKNKHRNDLHPFPSSEGTTSRIWSTPSVSKDTTSNACREMAYSGSGSAQERRSTDNKRFDHYTPRVGGGPVSSPDDGSEVELTLSIGSSSSGKNKRKSAQNWLHPSLDSGAVDRAGERRGAGDPTVAPSRGFSLSKT